MTAINTNNTGAPLVTLFTPEAINSLWRDVTEDLARKFVEDRTHTALMSFAPDVVEVVKVVKEYPAWTDTSFGFRRVEFKTADGLTLKWSSELNEHNCPRFYLVIEINGVKIAEAPVHKDFGDIFWRWKSASMDGLTYSLDKGETEILESSYDEFRTAMAENIREKEGK